VDTLIRAGDTLTRVVAATPVDGPIPAAGEPTPVGVRTLAAEVTTADGVTTAVAAITVVAAIMVVGAIMVVDLALALGITALPITGTDTPPATTTGRIIAIPTATTISGETGAHRPQVATQTNTAMPRMGISVYR
jgi:hypothetical protein